MDSIIHIGVLHTAKHAERIYRSILLGACPCQHTYVRAYLPKVNDGFDDSMVDGIGAAA